MPQHLKMPQSASPVARSGGGDISEKELSRERCNLFSTPNVRVQRSHPKKQLFSAPVNKFTARSAPRSPNFARIRSCLDEYTRKPVKVNRITAKASSMEDLTPTKRIKRDCSQTQLCIIKSPVLRSADDEQAANRIGKFMLVTAWRKRREEIRCVRKTLEFQVSCSERLRIQVCTLKSLLDSDNAKVRLAIRELERLKQLLREKDVEKALIEKEKQALEQDVRDAEDRASEMNIGWRNCRNELENARTLLAISEQTLSCERAATEDARAQRDHAYRRLALMEDDLAHHEAMLASAEEEVATLKQEINAKQSLIDNLNENLSTEIKTKNQLLRESSTLHGKLLKAKAERGALSALVTQLRDQLTRTQLELADTRRQLLWWPRPLTRMLGVARSWLRHPMALSEAVLWMLIPSRHGC